jgi:hypothetical protein
MRCTASGPKTLHQLAHPWGRKRRRASLSASDRVAISSFSFSLLPAMPGVQPPSNLLIGGILILQGKLWCRGPTDCACIWGRPNLPGTWSDTHTFMNTCGAAVAHLAPKCLVASLGELGKGPWILSVCALCPSESCMLDRKLQAALETDFASGRKCICTTTYSETLHAFLKTGYYQALPFPPHREVAALPLV